MQRTYARSAIAVAGLAFALGFAAPSVALADDLILEPLVADEENEEQLLTLTNSCTLTSVPSTVLVEPNGVAQDSSAGGNQGANSENVDKECESELVLYDLEDMQDSPQTTEDSQVTDGAVEVTMSAAAEDGTTENDETVVPESKPATVKDGTYQIISALSGTPMLDVYGNSAKAGSGAVNTTGNVQVNAREDVSTQQWVITYWKDLGGYYTIANGGYLLTVKTNAQGVAIDYGNVYLASQTKVNPSDAQLWYFEKSGSYYLIIPKSNDNLTLDISGASSKSGTNAIVYKKKPSSSDRNNQLFSVSTAGMSNMQNRVTNLADGNYRIAVQSQANYRIDISGASKADKANAILYWRNTGQNQEFHFQKVSGGYYIITAISSGKVLSTEDSVSGTSYSNVSQATYNGSKAQQWSIYKTNTGYEIVNRATVLALDVSGAQITKNNANIIGYTRKNSANQRFSITKVGQTLSEGIYTLDYFKKSGSVVEIKNASASNGATTQINSSDGSLAQRYQLVFLGVDSDGYERYRIRTAASGGWLTNTTGSSVVQQQGNHTTSVSNANSWRLVWNGTYFSMQNVASNRVLDVSGASMANGASVIAWTPNKGDNQHFYFTQTNLLAGYVGGNYRISSALGTSLGSADSNVVSTNAPRIFTFKSTGSTNNTYIISDVISGKAVEAINAGQCANVQLATVSGKTNQQWRAEIADGGYVTFVNVLSGGTNRVLDIYGNSNANGRNVEIYSQTYGNNQKWRMQHFGWEVVGSTYYFYDANGRQSSWNQSAYISWNEIKGMTSNMPYLATVDRDRCYVTIFNKQTEGVWEPYKNWRCSVGAKGHETPAGTWKVWNKSKYQLHDETYGVWYWTNFGPKGEAFHSVLTVPDSKKVKYSGLGKHNSAGCVRNPMDMAKWVYDNVKKGSTVHVF